MTKRFRVSRTSTTVRKFKQALGFYKFIFVLDQALVVEVKPKIIWIHLNCMDLINRINSCEVKVKEAMQIAGVKRLRVKLHAETIFTYTQEE